MARLVFASFWTVVFTGAVRKWIAPGVTVLYLLQDVPIGFSYIYALHTGLFTRGPLLIGIALLSVVVMLQGIFQVISIGLNPIIAAIGMHNYLFYLPMLVVFPWCFTAKYRADFVRWNLLLSLPMSLLAVVQAEMPKTAWINRTSEGDAFGLPGADIARVTGTFNFTLFYAIWVGMAVALCLGEWLSPKERRVFKNQWLLIACTFCVNICHLISASRGAVVLAGLAFVGAVIAAFILRSYRAIVVIAAMVLLLPIGAAVTYELSPVEFNVMVERFTGTSEVASSKSRILDGFIGFITVPQLSLTGAGIGMGVDAAHVGNADAYNFTYELSETDTIRNVMELGTGVGYLYVLTRFAFIAGMLILAINLVRDGCSPHVLPLAVYLMGQAFQGDLTRNAAMTATQVMMGYAFILGTFYHPDSRRVESLAIDSHMRYA